MATDEAGALAGLRVLELGEGVAPAYCGKWLAAFGAAVVRVEPPNAWMRRYHPFFPEAEPGDAPLDRYLNTGKQRLSLDLEEPAARNEVGRLLRDVDLLVHDLDASRRERLGLSQAELHALNPALVEVALSPFRAEGPYARYASTPIVQLALSGYQFLTGERGRPPLALPGFQPDYLAGLFCLCGALAALLSRGPDARGRRVELSTLEVMASLHQFTISQYLYQGTIRSRHGTRWENLYPITLLPCRDGYVGMAITLQDQWERLCGMLGQPELITDQRFATAAQRRANADALDAILMAWLAQRDKREVFREAQQGWRIPFGPLYDLHEVLDDPQYRARGYWTRPSESGPLQPGLPLQMSATPWTIRPDAPPAVAGRPHGEAGAQSIYPSPQQPFVAATATAADAALPLAGVRVLDFTRVWSGPLCTRILADLGAEVIKIEAPLPPGADPTLIATAAMNAAKLNRNKRRLVLDLRQARGREVVQRLVAKSDVLVENFSARVMPNFGLDYDHLRAINPALVMLAMPGFGSTGPYRDYAAYGPAIEPMTGLTGLLGYTGEAPLPTAIAYPDAVAGASGAAAVLIALTHQRRSGRGQFLDLSQVESTTNLIGEYILAGQALDTLPPRRGNRHPLWAPQGTYRCRGEDQWLSLSVRSDAEWRRFCEAAGLPALLANEAYADAAGRRQHHDALDAAIGAWTETRDKFEAMRMLQAAGVPAGAVLDARELLADPQLAALGFYVDAEARDERRYHMPGTPLSFDGRRRDAWRVSIGHGEDSRRILRDLLDLTDDEITALVAEGVLGAPA